VAGAGSALPTKGSYNFNPQTGQIVPVDVGNGSKMAGYVVNGYTYVPVKQLANMTGGELSNYNSQNLTIDVNGVSIPVFIDKNGVGYTPIRHMADAMGMEAGYNQNAGGGVSDVYLRQGQQQTLSEPAPVTDEEGLRLADEKTQMEQMIQQLLQQMNMPPEMPGIPEFQNPYYERQQLIYEDFLEQARAMINPEYAKARETISQVNEQQRQLMMQRLAGKGQPFGGLREELEMQLSSDLMSQLSDQDMAALQQSYQVAQSLSEQDEEKARWLAEQAFQQWQAQANMTQQNYSNQVSTYNNNLARLMDIAKYYQDIYNTDQAAQSEAERLAQEQSMEQAKLDWQQQEAMLKYLYPSMDTVYQNENISATDQAKMSLDEWMHQTPSGNSQLSYQGSLANANARLQAANISAANSQSKPTQWQLQAQADQIANQLAPALGTYKSWDDLQASIERMGATPGMNPYVLESLQKLANDNYRYKYFANSAVGEKAIENTNWKSGYDPLRVNWNQLFSNQTGLTIPGQMPGQ
jgi:hypothetical protein